MQEYRTLWKKRWDAPWMRVILYTTAMLILPEYFAPALAPLALGAAVKDARRRESGLCGGSFTVPLALYIVYSLLGLIYSVVRLSTLASVLMWAVSAFYYIALVTVITDRRRLSTALAYLISGVGVNGLMATVQYVCKGVFRLNVDMQAFKWLDRLLNNAFGYPLYADFGSRASASFTNPNILGEFFVLFLPFVFYYLSRQTNLKRTSAVRLSALLIAFGLLFTFCRGAYLALLLIAALHFAINIKKAPFLLVITMAILLLIPQSVYARIFSLSGAGGYIGGVMDNVKGDKEHGGDGDLLDSILDNADKAPDSTGEKPPKAFSERVQVWSASLDAILKRPLFGYGAGELTICRLLKSYKVAPPHAHNLALQLLLEGGILSLGIWFSMAFSVLRKGYRLLVRSTDNQSGMAAVSFICGVCVVGLTDYPFLTPKLVSGVLIALALIDVMYQQNTADKKIRLLSEFTPGRRKAVNTADGR